MHETCVSTPLIIPDAAFERAGKGWVENSEGRRRFGGGGVAVVVVVIVKKVLVDLVVFMKRVLEFELRIIISLAGALTDPGVRASALRGKLTGSSLGRIAGILPVFDLVALALTVDQYEWMK
ncbi:hypothetical protein SBOR_1813 [Sclerotinia borealis F-4128]|uniref:Uncharacterized protein n=1 Tax=Sclerotinia borealis (strain F-4128) TaxID=1432307 RepID=W9CTC6_SCLBF|nr:hypothetical protein SBOR_1813 [Sclerotinia borealis F-4128]